MSLRDTDEKFDEFDPGTNFKAWAFAVTRIEILRFVGDRKRHSKVMNLDEKTLEELDDLEMREPEEIADFRKDTLLECVGKLGDAEKGLVRLRYGDGLSIKEIARRLRATGATLRVKLFRIRQWLGDCVRTGLKGA